MPPLPGSNHPLGFFLYSLTLRSKYTTFLRNVRDCLPNDIASHPISHESSITRFVVFLSPSSARITPRSRQFRFLPYYCRFIIRESINHRRQREMLSFSRAWHEGILGAVDVLVQHQFILNNMANGWRFVVTFTPRPSYPTEITPVPITVEDG